MEVKAVGLNFERGHKRTIPPKFGSAIAGKI